MNLHTPSFAGLFQPPQWTPNNITDLYAWFDAQRLDSITKDGSNNVTQWTDISGKGGNLTSSGTTYPVYSSTGLNSRPALGFTSASELFFNNYMLDFLRNQTKVTIIMVLTRNEANAGRYYYYWSNGVSASSTRLEVTSRTDTSFNLGARQADGDSFYVDNPNAANTPAQGSNFIHRLQCNYSGGTPTMYTSNYSDATALPTLAGFGRTTTVTDTRSVNGWLGAGTETSAAFSIGEFILVRNTLTADEVTKISVYLKAKWGL
jgi:hypothetical protein